MLVKFLRPIGVVAAAAALAVSAWGQAAQGTNQAAQGQGQPQRNWKDRAEYDLYESIVKTSATDPAKALEQLNQWKEKYPQTDFIADRQLLFLNTYQKLNQADRMLEVAREIVTRDPKDMTGLYWINVLTVASPTAAKDPQAIGQAEQAANSIIANLDTQFGADKKPAQATAEQWTKARNDMEALARKTLGWVNMMRKNNDVAEKEFRRSLELNPAAGEVAYWLGTTLYSQKKVPDALFFFARAASYEGPGSLAPAGRKDIDTYLTKAYTGYHGDLSGLPELKKMASTTAVPPAGFKIKSVTEVFEEKQAAEQQAMAQDPQGALWKRIKGELTGEGGDAYFESSMKGAKPPEKSFRGKVVSATPKEIRLAMSDDTNPEAVLRFETAVPNVEPGTTLQFTGTAQSYTKEPFMVTFDAERADVVGFPAAAKAKPAKAKRGGGRRR